MGPLDGGMSAIEEFLTATEGDVMAHVTESDGFEDVLASVVEPPAIGTPLPFESVTLAGTGVETDFSPASLEAAKTGVTPVSFGISNYGTLSLCADADGTELASLYPPRHVGVLAASDFQTGMKDAFERLEAEFEAGRDTQVLATGPSATADMGTLVSGVHGPGEVHAVVLEDR
jgi:L-lactate dehydrogenase complex protein LldG